MKHFAEYTRIVREQSTSTCDICGEKIDWECHCDPYCLKEARIEYKDGSRYPEGGDHIEFAPDICSACMREKVIPLIEPLLLRKVWEEINEEW